MAWPVDRASSFSLGVTFGTCFIHVIVTRAKLTLMAARSTSYSTRIRKRLATNYPNLKHELLDRQNLSLHLIIVLTCYNLPFNFQLELGSLLLLLLHYVPMHNINSPVYVYKSNIQKRNKRVSRI